jgi:tetratricopeptide (TPR) repeat protein
MATGNLLLAEHVSGNQEAAVALAEEVLHLSQRAPFLWCTIGARSILGIYALERGALEAAREYRREILAHAGGRDFWGSDASYAEIFFARLTVQEGDWQAALERLDQAIAAYAERDFFCRSRLQLERARLLLSHDPKAAERQAVEVRRRGREAGARPLIEQANAILDRLSGHSRR